MHRYLPQRACQSQKYLSTLNVSAPCVDMSRYLDDRRDAVSLLGDVGDERGPPLYDLPQRYLRFDDANVAVLQRQVEES